MTQQIPSEMNCIDVSAPGGPEALILGKRPVPKPGPGEVLIEVHAAGVNRADTVQRQGNYAPPPGATDILGLECAGVVVAHGEGVTAPAIGSRVCALLVGGGYAEYVATPAGSCLPIPEGYDFVKAACLPETIMTVWPNVFERGALKPGEIFMVHGGASGIGTTAIQIAKQLGSTVIATAGTDKKCEACRKLGADLAINYKTADFVAEIKKTPAKGVDVILDMVGGDYMAKNLSVLRPDGRLVFVSAMQGSKATIEILPMMFKRLHITGSSLRSRENSFKAALAEAVRTHVWPLIAAGKFSPVLDRTYPLDQAAEAHRRMDGNLNIGKIILDVRGN
jgi:putative PIG3 family NAD(P)H quinone oxidoreductase